MTLAYEQEQRRGGTKPPGPPRKRKGGGGRKPSPPKSDGEQAADWIEDFCCIPEGPDVGKPVKLRGWQRDLLKLIYDNPAGTRRAIISFGRKSGKTAFSAFLVLLHLVGIRAKENSHIYSAAQSRDQASILFALAAKIVRLNPVLAHHITIRDARKELACKALGTDYRALSAEASTAYGLSPVLTIFDELGQVRGPRSELYEALETATAAQEKPLSVIISTQAPGDNDLLSVLIDDALAQHDPRTVLALYTAANDLDPFGETAIRAANPAFGDFQNADEVLAMAADAKRMPSREAEYRNLILNQRVQAESPFITRSLWQACYTGPVAPIDNCAKVYGGLDLSAVDDLTALVLIGNVNDRWQVHPIFWLPRDGIFNRAKTDRVPYDLWLSTGQLVAAPGNSVDYEFVATHLLAAFQRYKIDKIGFDRWNFAALKTWLLKVGFTERQIEKHFVESGQGFQWMSPALRTFKSEILNGRINHGNHPVLSMCAMNAVVQKDPAGNEKLAKNRSTGRIDGMVALAMAFGVANIEPKRDKKPSIFIL